MKLHRIAIAAGALTLASLAGGANAAAPSLDKLQFGAQTDVTPVRSRNCVPIYRVVRVHATGSSFLVWKKKLIGFRCFPIAVLVPKFPIPDPGPYGRVPGRIPGKVGSRHGF